MIYREEIYRNYTRYCRTTTDTTINFQLHISFPPNSRRNCSVIRALGYVQFLLYPCLRVRVCVTSSCSMNWSLAGVSRRDAAERVPRVIGGCRIAPSISEGGRIAGRGGPPRELSAQLEGPGFSLSSSVWRDGCREGLFRSRVACVVVRHLIPPAHFPSSCFTSLISRLPMFIHRRKPDRWIILPPRWSGSGKSFSSYHTYPLSPGLSQIFQGIRRQQYRQGWMRNCEKDSSPVIGRPTWIAVSCSRRWHRLSSSSSSRSVSRNLTLILHANVHELRIACRNINYITFINIIVAIMNQLL